MVAGGAQGSHSAYEGSLPPSPGPLPAAFQAFVVPVSPGFRMSLMTLEQFGAASAHVVQQVEALSAAPVPLPSGVP